MTLIPEIEQLSETWVWYGTDCDGALAHFVKDDSLLLPPRVADSDEDLERLYAHIRELPARSLCSISPSDLTEHFAHLGLRFPNSNPTHFIDLVCNVARQGLYYYFSAPVRLPPPRYLRLAAPRSPLLISSMPDAIQQAAARFRHHSPFANSPMIEDTWSTAA